MPKKTPPARVGITDLEGVDRALLKLAQATLKRKKLEAETQLQINALKERLAVDAAPYDAIIEELDADILDFAQEHAAELFGAGKKTVDCVFGKLAARETSKIQIKNLERTVELLKEKGWRDAIITKESPNKEALAGFADDDLKSVGAKRVVEDVISYKLDFERVQQEPA